MRSKSSKTYETSEHHSVSIRKINNGYIVSKSHSGPKGYESNEIYHERRPKIDIQSIPHVGAPSGRSPIDTKALRKAAGCRKVKDT